MNAIEQHFAEIEIALIKSPAISAYRIIRNEATSFDGKLRVKVGLENNGFAEFSQYVVLSENKIQVKKYSYH